MIAMVELVGTEHGFEVIGAMVIEISPKIRLPIVGHVS